MLRFANRCVVLVAVVVAGVAVDGVGAAAERPNIVFIFADDWGYGDLSCHGSETYRTPHIDRMAAEGTDFRQFTVSNPVCSPSRTAVMTGHFPARHSVHRHFASIKHHMRTGMPDWLDPETTMLPRLLRRAGYATGHFGKWHLTNRHVPDSPLPSAYGYDDAAVFNGPGTQVNADPRKDTPLPTEKAIDFIRRHEKGPFFLNLWLHATHVPHYPTKRWMAEFEHLGKREQVYAAVLAEADERVGDVLSVLKELGLAKETLVIFSSDNGPESPTRRRRGSDSTGRGYGRYYSVGTTAGRRGQKRSLYNGGVGVPFIVRWPGETPAGRVDETTVLTAVDLLPTFCAAAGVELPEGYRPDGQNMLPALRGRTVEREKPIFWDWRGNRGGANWPRLAVRKGPWKLLMNHDASRVELYRMPVDPEESNNLAGHHPAVVKRLIEKAQAWRESLPEEPPEDCLSEARPSESD